MFEPEARAKYSGQMKATRAIVLTGATRGLGRAMVDEFVRAGHTVIGCGRSADGIKELGQSLGEPHNFSQVDVSSDVQVAAWAADVIQNFGAPDLLLNNAAVINRNARLWEVPAEEFSRVIDVNIKGVANVIRHFVPEMVKQGRGVIVNWSSGWGRSTDAEVGPYCATKWAIEGLSQSLAQELPEGMASVAFNPGVIDTEMLQSCFGESAHECQSPKHWAKNAVPFLLKIGPKDSGRPLTAPI